MLFCSAPLQPLLCPCCRPIITNFISYRADAHLLGYHVIKKLFIRKNYLVCPNIPSKITTTYYPPNYSGTFPSSLIWRVLIYWYLLNNQLVPNKGAAGTQLNWFCCSLLCRPRGKRRPATTCTRMHVMLTVQSLVHEKLGHKEG